MKKGFTLLELLAVVIVLAIVTLIAIPIIMNVIEKSKKGSAVDSTYGYIDVIEKSVAVGQLDSNKGITIPDNNTLSMENIENLEVLDSINLKGEKPEYVVLNFERKKVVSAGLCIDGYNIKYENKKAEVIANPDNTNDYCKKANVKEIRINNAEEIGLTWNPDNSNEGQISMTSGQHVTLSLSFITKDGKQPDDVEITKIPTDSSSVTIDEENYKITANTLGSATVLIRAGIRYKKINVDVGNDSILGYLQIHDFASDCAGLYDENGMCDIAEKTITANGQTYQAHIYNYNQDLEISGTVAYGVAGDVASGTAAANMAKRMVILKVNGNLTINSGGILRPYYHSSYGGPKGFVIYVTGTIINNGRIDNSHGAYANGQDVILWQNADTSERDEFEKVPASGAAGAAKKQIKGGTKGTIILTSGSNGTNGTGRQTGGGGQGSGMTGSQTYLQAGGRGTSYSGGTGSGNVNGCNGGGPNNSSAAGSSTGGAGGVGLGDQTSSCVIIGGAGNPQPGTGRKASSDTVTAAKNGTGGLLIIYAKSVINNANSQITANGANGGYALMACCNHKFGSGASGGGSINIFYEDDYTVPTTLTANGGGKGNTNSTGGVGGRGTITVGRIEEGTFVPYSA